MKGRKRLAERTRIERVLAVAERKALKAKAKRGKKTAPKPEKQVSRTFGTRDPRNMSPFEGL